MLADFISRFADNKRAAAVCYLLPFVLLPVKLALLPVGPILLLIVAVLAPQTSHLRFHAIQAIVLSIVCIAGLGLVYLFGRFWVDPEGGFISVLIDIGAWLFLSGGILLAFFIFSGVLFFKTWQGKMVQLSWLGEWADAVSEGDYSVLKLVVVLLGIVVVLQMSNHYKTEEKPEQPPVISQNLLQELDTYFNAFPMGATKEEVYNNAREVGSKTELKYSNAYGTSNKEVVFSEYPAHLQFLFHDYFGNSSLWLMNIKMASKNAPIEQIYWQLHKELTERYGQPQETGYPPWRNSGTKAWGPGEGALWEISPVGGKAFTLMIGWQPEEYKGDGRGELRIQCRKEENE